VCPILEKIASYLTGNEARFCNKCQVSPAELFLSPPFPEGDLDPKKMSDTRAIDNIVGYNWHGHLSGFPFWRRGGTQKAGNASPGAGVRAIDERKMSHEARGVGQISIFIIPPILYSSKGMAYISHARASIRRRSHAAALKAVRWGDSARILACGSDRGRSESACIRSAVKKYHDAGCSHSTSRAI
jgi:hypothetical protein